MAVVMTVPVVPISPDPAVPMSEEAKSLLHSLSDLGVEVTKIEIYEDDLGVSAHWHYRGLHHSSGGSTVEEALAYVVFHIGQGMSS